MESTLISKPKRTHRKGADARIEPRADCKPSSTMPCPDEEEVKTVAFFPRGEPDDELVSELVALLDRFKRGKRPILTLLNDTTEIALWPRQMEGDGRRPFLSGTVKSRRNF